jgi:modulator of FtsH protease
MEEAGHWSDFFVAEVGAAAALSGLVVVAISINLQRILAVPVLPGRAAETLFMLVCAMLVSSAGLIPGQSPLAFGIEAMALGAALGVVSIYTQLRTLSLMKSAPVHWWALRLVVSLIVVVPLLVGGGLLLCGKVDGVYWIAGGVLALLTAGVFNSWVLLVEILR